ncbi:MAG: hypothetical protein OES34_11740 [Nitrosopumilus sp.]|nr:hypothetical protein [Nitrosopumilus sp.]
MKVKASEHESIWYQVQKSFMTHKYMLEKGYLHDKFVFKACLMHPSFYHNMMQDEQAKFHAVYQTPITELTLWGIPLKITTEVESISWVIDLIDD